MLYRLQIGIMNYEGLFLQESLQGQEEIHFEVSLLFIIITGLK